jgi:hypothetical protein
MFVKSSGVRRNFFVGGGGGALNKFCLGQGERVSGGGSPLVRGSAQFAND